MLAVRRWEVRVAAARGWEMRKEEVALHVLR